MAKTIQRSAQKVNVINSNNNTLIKTIRAVPVSIRGFDSFPYDGRLYAAFVNDKQENVIYVDPTLTTDQWELEENA